MRPLSMRKQKGSSPILMSIFVAVFGVIVIEGANFSSKRSQDVSEMAVDRLHLQAANEAALEQLAQLLGATILKPNDAVDAFIRGTGYEVTDEDSEDIPMGSWALDENGQFLVQSCLSSNVGVDAKEAFGSDKTSAWMNAADCEESKIVTTRVRPTSLLDPERITNARASAYLMVEAQSQATQGAKMNRSARLTLPAATAQCDAGFDEEFCSTDHCPYMMPVRNRNGDVMYSRDESGAMRPKLMPNPDFVSNYKIPRSVFPSGLEERSVLYRDGEERPTQMIQFLQKAFAPGRINPFDGVQGIQGELFSQTNENLVADSDFIYVSVPNELKGHSDSMLQFEGFLQNVIRRGSDSLGAAAGRWKPSTPFDDPAYSANLKEACGRSIGNPGADFCARMKLSYAVDTYYYKAMRVCRYSGPPGELMTDPQGVRMWRPTPNNIAMTEWKDSTETAPGFTVIKNDVKAFQDDEQHHDFDPNSAQGFRKMPHSFDDVRVGTIVTKEVKWFPGPPAAEGEDPEIVDDTVVDEVVAEEDAEALDMEPQGVWKERMVTRIWEAECSVRELQPGQNPPGFTPPVNKMDMCFYVGYFNSGSRLEARAQDGNNPNMCRRELSSVRCRNLNGCFTAETLVLMADGTEKMISKIKKGDRVFNPMTKSSVQVSEVISGPQQRDMYRITTDKGTAVTATWNHPFETPKGFYRGYQMKLGDHIRGAKGHWQEIVDIEVVPLDNQNQVWNLTLDGMPLNHPGFVATHHFVANGLATGDYVIQQSNLDTINQHMKDGRQNLQMSFQKLEDHLEWKPLR